MTKSHKLPFSSSTTVYNNPLELVVSDIWGPDPLVSNNGSRYYIIFMDVFSRYLFLFPLAKQSDALAVFISSKNKIERLLDCKIKTFQSNNGGEYIKFKKFLDYQHISHCFSCSRTPEQNGLAECLHRQIVETGLALFHTSSIPPTYWDDAFQTTCYLIDRLPSSVNPTKSPLEILFHTSPEYNQLRAFGCECYPFLRPYTAHKLSPRSLPCVFLGYSPSHKGYKCLHLPSNRFYISRHVVFNETVFPFAQVSTRSQISIPEFLVGFRIPHLSCRHPPLMPFFHLSISALPFSNLHLLIRPIPIHHGRAQMH